MLFLDRLYTWTRNELVKVGREFFSAMEYAKGRPEGLPMMVLCYSVFYWRTAEGLPGSSDYFCMGWLEGGTIPFILRYSTNWPKWSFMWTTAKTMIPARLGTPSSGLMFSSALF